jgi:hypothetical protein
MTVTPYTQEKGLCTWVEENREVLERLADETDERGWVIEAVLNYADSEGDAPPQPTSRTTGSADDGGSS